MAVRVDQIPELAASGKIKSLESMNEQALRLHPGGTITDSDLDNHFNGYEYGVELRDASGAEWDVTFDAATGQVLSNKQDN
ncbi:PepSY domain-containing protein [Streptomyces flavidovirens]